MTDAASDAYREALLKVFPVACNAFQILREGHVHRCGGVNCAGVLHECYVCGEFFNIPGDLHVIDTTSNPLLGNKQRSW